MDVNGIQQNLGSALIELETGIPELTGADPLEANAQIQQSKTIVMDTQVRLSKSMNDMAYIEKQINNQQLTDQQQQTDEVVSTINQTQNLETGAMTINKKEIKAFNLKKQAQFGQPPVAPFGADNFNDTAELGEDKFNMEQDFMQEESTFEDGLDRKAFTDYLIQLAQDPNGLFQFVKENTSPENGEVADQLTEQFNIIVEDPARIDETDQIAGQIYDLLDDSVKAVPDDTEFGIPTAIAETNEIIKKLAKEYVAKKATAFNLTKTAQHKTEENVILHGSQNKKFDPFYRQNVSDWSIIERNKGFGLVFDDITDIDYEAIWRGTVMDKYSRPYRDKEGNWVGGYINKRFEVDHNIPETNNYQLKPGQLRRATPPEYGSTESRLQAARAAGDIKGGPEVDKTKPFNWKEASAKKKKLAFNLAPKKEKDPFEIKELVLDPKDKGTQAERYCIECGSCLGEKDFSCPNCGCNQQNVGQAHKRSPAQKGRQYNPFSNDPHSNPLQVQRGVPIPKMFDTNTNMQKEAVVEDPKEKEKVDPDIVPYESDEILQCVDPSELHRRKNRRKVDDKLEEVSKSCLDLAIDG